MSKVFEILVPLALIIVLLMCMMNNTSEEAFNVGGTCKRDHDGSNVGGQHKEPFNVGGTCKRGHDRFNVGGQHEGQHKHKLVEKFNVGAQGQSDCKVTMVWADWCGYSNKAKPEWDKLVAEHDGKVINGCKMSFEDAEEKQKPDIVKKFKTTGFPSYYVNINNSKHEEFNSIKKEDMLTKIKASIDKIKGSPNSIPVEGVQEGPQPKPVQPKPVQPKPVQPKPVQPKPVQPKPVQPKPVQPMQDKAPGVKSTIEGELLYSDCNNAAYGPVSLDSVVQNLSGIGNSIQNVVGYGDCTELEFAPIKLSTGGPQIPSMNSLGPSLGQLKAPGADGIQGTIRPLAFNGPNAGNAKGGNAKGGKEARITMVRADWCGFCKKAMPEWEKLKTEIHDKVVNGYHVILRDLEHKKDEAEIKKDYSDVNGFPTYVAEEKNSDGTYTKLGNFNGIEKDDIHNKIKGLLN